jgi:predicted metal-dependent HD superfamily phosphohydrolase
MSRQADNQKIFSFSEALTQDLSSDWRALAEEFSVENDADGAVFALLLKRYSEKHRFYHNLSHVRALLVLAEDFREKFSDYDCVRLAIWFHDAIYELRRNDNEIESARLVATQLSRFGLPADKIQKVEKMILATARHEASELDFDGKLFLDLDLSILGASRKIYKKYSQAVRSEYFFVPQTLYSEGRKKILENFLRREFIYLTAEMRLRFEAAARVNIENEIKELS